MSDELGTLSADTDRSLQLLEEFGLMSEDDLAALLGKRVKTLRNTPIIDLPDFTTAGHRRLFFKSSVQEFLEARKVSAKSASKVAGSSTPHNKKERSNRRAAVA